MHTNTQYAGKRELNTVAQWLNTFGGQATITKQEPVHYINTRGRYNYSNNKISQTGPGVFRGRSYPCGTQEDNNNGIQIWTFKNKVTNAETNTVKITYNFARQRTRFFQNATREVILQRSVVPKMLTTWEIDMINSRKKLKVWSTNGCWVHFKKWMAHLPNRQFLGYRYCRIFWD